MRFLGRFFKKLVYGVDCCPTCQRDFDSFSDYPYINVTGFEREKIPRIVSTGMWDLRPIKEGIDGLNREVVPFQVSDWFSKNPESKIFSFEGKTYSPATIKDYFACGNDISSLIRSVVELPQIRKVLGYLEGLVGKRVQTSQLVSKSFFEVELPAEQNLGYDDLSIRLNDNQKRRALKLNLLGGFSGGSVSVAHVNQNLATMSYEGVIKV